MVRLSPNWDGFMGYSLLIGLESDLLCAVLCKKEIASPVSLKLL